MKVPVIADPLLFTRMSKVDPYEAATAGTLRVAPVIVTEPVEMS